MKEERRHPRFEQEVVISFEPTVPQGAKPTGLLDMPAWLLGLSEGGAMIRTERYIPVPTPLSIQLSIGSEGSNRTMSVDGIVRWAKSADEGHPFNLGIEFLRVDPDDLNILREYLRQLEGSHAPTQH